MLLRFSASNHLSLREEQELSLVASSLKDESRTALIDCASAPRGKVLPAVVIYGANASGKTNVLLALDFMRRAVMSSHREGEPGGRIPRAPFALDPASAEKPSTFDADFTVGDIRYHYGFAATDQAFEAEWLYRFPNARRQLVFDRQGQDFTFGRGLRGRNSVIADLTRPNSLFLSAAAQNGHEELSRVSAFFTSLRTSRTILASGSTVSSSLGETEIDERVISFLAKFDTGIVNSRRNERELSDEERAMAKAITSAIRTFVELPQMPAREGRSDVELGHRGVGSEPVFLDLDLESAGTRRLLLLLGPIFAALDQGSVITVDELDVSLHSQICEAIIALFSSRQTNPRGAQLIATTHNTNLLSTPFLRRDQIWFTEKDLVGATHLYSLADIRSRKSDNFERGYLQGRYGAVAVAGPVEDFMLAN